MGINDGLHNAMYIYPDMKTMIVGTFNNATGQLITGLEAELKSLEVSDNGLMLPTYEIIGQRAFRYSLSNQTFIGLDPLLRDPMEDKYFKVAISSIKGAGRGM